MDRRLFLSVIAGTAALPNMLRALPLPPPQPHRLNLANPHTGETFSGIYRDDNGPIPRVMDELSVFLRDFHSGEKIAIDVGVLDFLSSVMQAVGQSQAMILSAYRTPQTNAMLAKTHFGVAENSQHLYGRALDVHFGDKLADAMKAARAMQRGGVGWYPHSGFMHMDTGPVRNWDLDHPKLVTLISGNRRAHPCACQSGGRHRPRGRRSNQAGSFVLRRTATFRKLRLVRRAPRGDQPCPGRGYARHGPR